MQRYHSPDEEEAAAAVVSLKRSPDRYQPLSHQTVIALSDERARKILKRSNGDDDDATPRHHPAEPRCATPSSEGSSRSIRSEDVNISTCDSAASFRRGLRDSPYFYYRDHSLERDADPLSPLTPPGRVPNFPAKMHAIMSRHDLEDVVAWQSHGRAWRILDAKAFETKVLRQYFQHGKMSSFIRQSNGWGFRRITRGSDRNCYYHELFLRGMPHLCKGMKRPGVAKKVTGDPEHEPDFYEINESRRVPEIGDVDAAILLPCTIRDGPNARMPVTLGIDGLDGPAPTLKKTSLTVAPSATAVVTPTAPSSTAPALPLRALLATASSLPLTVNPFLVAQLAAAHQRAIEEATLLKAGVAVRQRTIEEATIKAAAAARQRAIEEATVKATAARAETARQAEVVKQLAAILSLRRQVQQAQAAPLPPRVNAVDLAFAAATQAADAPVPRVNVANLSFTAVFAAAQALSNKAPANANTNPFMMKFS